MTDILRNKLFALASTGLVAAAFAIAPVTIDSTGTPTVGQAYADAGGGAEGEAGEGGVSGSAGGGNDSEGQSGGTPGADAGGGVSGEAGPGGATGEAGGGSAEGDGGTSF